MGTQWVGELAIERWWPKLGIEEKHRLLESIDEPDVALDPVVAVEIRAITGATELPPGLDDSARAFIRTQIETVD
ncbi:MAG TPA: hypothetical protein VFU07_09750 [Candidatus Lumbricidophila sp.]|nr:hypothetical protein [Candidatus Lumbricidophila sp.]